MDDLRSPCDYLLRRSNQVRGLSEEFGSSQAQGKAMIMRCSRGKNGKSDNHRKEDGDAAQWAIMMRGDEGDEPADD